MGWQDRLRAEARQLTERLEKLEQFLVDPPPELRPEQRRLLDRQCRVMFEYRQILDERISYL